MRLSGKRLLFIGSALLAALMAAPVVVWLSLTHKPTFYRQMVSQPRGQQQEKEAKQFLAQSLQLSNDIRNEPTWEAIFSDQQVNAWLAEDLMKHFADQLPPEVHEPRVMFEMDRVTLAFELDQGPVRSVIWVVAKPRVPEGNVLELTLEKIRAGVVPIPPEQILAKVMERAKAQGLDVTVKHEADQPVVVIRYVPVSGRDDVMLEKVQVVKGELHLAGSSDHARGDLRSPTLPSRRVLQSKFPKRPTQEPSPPVAPLPETALRNANSPMR
jgi:hypothetical protein